MERQQREQGEEHTATEEEQQRPATPEPGHPYPGEGVGMPERGAGRAKMDSTPPIGTEDQGEPTDSALEGENN